MCRSCKRRRLGQANGRSRENCPVLLKAFNEAIAA